MNTGKKNNKEGWQQALQNAIRSPKELLKTLELEPKNTQAYDPKRTEFPLLVPHSFVKRMRKRDPKDPLLLQVLPTKKEQLSVPGFTRNPLLETSFITNGVVKKYLSRALLLATEACPVHCRYCFRRFFPYSNNLASTGNWENALAELGNTDETREVILSGGDPLSLSNRRLEELITKIELLKNITTLRVHTRFPVILPNRVDNGLLKLFSRKKLKIVVVIHSNHAQEIDESVYDSMQALSSTGTHLFNQSVLLRDVNDNASQLEALSRKLFESSVIPYYLNILDPVEGSAHFEVDINKAKQLIKELRQRLPGYLVPRLVREIPGELSKKIIA
ncbi:MAG: EF-P beta-lysylation protein EpmB [Rhodospirillaceae bacterium]|nr:EF-P beta-lysylation protein EpmB [Rhodospirillaceae bacterium]|tara:strand:+ start:4428 stop:5426 length:999 start_codon:yes stop_codon:yes gene_type:complete